MNGPKKPLKDRMSAQIIVRLVIVVVVIVLLYLSFGHQG
jgi:hypothetical protein